MHLSHARSTGNPEKGRAPPARDQRTQKKQQEKTRKAHLARSSTDTPSTNLTENIMGRLDDSQKTIKISSHIYVNTDIYEYHRPITRKQETGGASAKTKRPGPRGIKD